MTVVPRDPSQAGNLFTWEGQSYWYLASCSEKEAVISCLWNSPDLMYKAPRNKAQEKKKNLREEGKRKRNYCKSTIFPDQNLVFRQHKTCQALSAVEWLDLCISARFTEEIYARNTNWITGPPPFLHKREELLHFWSSCCLYGSWLLGLCSDHKTSACNFYLLPVIVSRTILSLQCKLE